MYYFAYSTEPGFGIVRLEHNSGFALDIARSGNNPDSAPDIARSERTLDPDQGLFIGRPLESFVWREIENCCAVEYPCASGAP